VIVIAVVLIGSMSRGGAPTDPDAAIKAARSFMFQRSPAFQGPRTQMVEKKATASKIENGYKVKGQVAFKQNGKEPASYDKWEATVLYDTTKKAWIVKDWKP
jgi:hypothetical protein